MCVDVSTRGRACGVVGIPGSSFFIMDKHWPQLYGRQQGQGVPDLSGDTQSMLVHLAQVAQEKAGESERLEAASKRVLSSSEVDSGYHVSPKCPVWMKHWCLLGGAKP